MYAYIFKVKVPRVRHRLKSGRRFRKMKSLETTALAM